jgi:Zn-finger nucleic acid-binding protein
MGQCPHCRVDLAVLTHSGINWAGCPKCQGVWLAGPDVAKALRLYAADQGVALETIALLEGVAQPSALPCPQCPASTLQVITLRGVEVEKCVSCRGVFLDRGEGEAIAKRVVFSEATWKPAHQELMRTVRKRLSLEQTLRATLSSEYRRLE